MDESKKQTMIVKHILAFDSGNLPEIKSAHYSIFQKGITAGIRLKDACITKELGETLQTLSFPYVLILDHQHNTQEKDRSGKRTDSMIQAMLDPGYLSCFGKKPLFILGDASGDDLQYILQRSFQAYGLHNVEVVNLLREDAGSKEHQAVTSWSGADRMAYNIRWTVIKTDTRNIAADHIAIASSLQTQLENDPNARDQEQLARLQEDNQQLTTTIDILLRNIHDLNNYYRYVRGETHFKHHNRDEETAPQAAATSAKTPPVHPGELADKEKYVAFYSSVYENKPGWYKKGGTLLRVLLGRREALFYLSKRHKKEFMDLISCLSPEKQVQVWYYYEYEILPGWYKKIGQMLKK